MKSAKLKKVVPFLPVAVLILVFVYAYFSNPFQNGEIFCLLNAKTGVKCPTCGITRAIYSVLIGKWGNAFYYHALFTVGFIPLTAMSTLWGINYCFLGGKIKFLKVRWIYLYSFLATVLLFTVFRNLTDLIF